jgi:hypothetical protein
MAKKLLDLNKLVDRNFIIIDGERYDLKTNDELPPITINTLGLKVARVFELQNKQPITDDERTELTGLPRQICDEVLIAPKEVIDKLTPEQRWSVCLGFLYQRIPTAIGMVMTDPMALEATAPAGAISIGAS